MLHVLVTFSVDAFVEIQLLYLDLADTVLPLCLKYVILKFLFQLKFHLKTEQL